jgi:hypothetical protein
MADYRMPLSQLPVHVLAKILCDVAESETETGLVELLEARGYGTLLLFLNSSPHLLNWLAYVNTRTWVRLMSDTTFARDVAELRYTSRVHDLCDLARPTTGSTATTARRLLQLLRDSGAYAPGSPQATLLDDGIAGRQQRYPPVPRDASFQQHVTRSKRDGGRYGPLEVWDTRNVTSMRSAFFILSQNHRAALDLAFWDTRRVTDMTDMFLNVATTCTGLRNWNTSSVTSMRRMFFNCDWTPDVADWVTSSVRDAGSMFACRLLGGSACNPDVRRWDTRALESADRMFFCLVKFNRDLSRWDTRRLRRATQMFFGCPIAEAHKPRVPDEHGRAPEDDFVAREEDRDRPDFRFVGGQYV